MKYSRKKEDAKFSTKIKTQVLQNLLTHFQSYVDTLEIIINNFFYLTN